MKTFLGILTAIALLGFTGCGDDDNALDERCKVVCQKQVDCDQAPVPGDQCDSVCTANADNTKTSGCDDEYDALLTCSEKLDDICQVATDCAQIGLNWSGCLQRYCQTNPGTGYCAQ